MILRLSLTKEEIEYLILILNDVDIPDSERKQQVYAKLNACYNWDESPERDNALSEKEQARRSWWLGIIKSAKQHLEKPMAGGKGYYLPPAEKVVAQMGLNKLHKEFFNSYDFKLIVRHLQGRLNKERAAIKKIREEQEFITFLDSEEELK